MTNKCLIPVILCGGKGSRLWPLSRASYPKQYWALNENNQNSLLQETYQRLKGINDLGKPLLICNEDHRFIVAEQMRQINVNPNAILLEPISRNTAPAIAIAALKAIKIYKNPTLLILASDHIIEDKKAFIQAINAGKIEAEKGNLVTFGVIPKTPETGYGYIKTTQSYSNQKLEGLNISSFIEKPNLENAKKYLEEGNFLWNSGIFLFKAKSIINELKKFVPEIVSSCEAALQGSYEDLEFIRIDSKSFSECPKLPIDIAVMEKTKLGKVIPLEAGWNDIGTWNALWDTSKKDKNGNVLKGNVISQDNKNCYLRSEHRLVVGIGVQDLIIVETDDAILISNKDQAQKVKSIVEKLESEKKIEGKSHKTIYRPWGNYTNIVNGEQWQVKRIIVKAGESLSLQMHHHRAEHWVVVKGTALIEKDGDKKILNENESTYIPIGCKHRLTNPGQMSMELIEVQSGKYLGEDDIIRFEDSYGRTK